MKCWSSTEPTIPKSPRLRPATSQSPWPFPSTSNICWWAASGSQSVNVFDLDTLQADTPIKLPSGFTALSIASSANATLAQGGYYDGTFHILQLDIPQPYGNSVAYAGRFYQSNQRQHRIDRLAKRFFDPGRASRRNGLFVQRHLELVHSFQEGLHVAGRSLRRVPFQSVCGRQQSLDSSLVPVLQFETGTGSPSGFAFVNQTGFRSNAPPPAGSTTDQHHRAHYHDDHDDYHAPATVKARPRASWNGST